MLLQAFERVLVSHFRHPHHQLTNFLLSLNQVVMKLVIILRGLGNLLETEMIIVNIGVVQDMMMQGHLLKKYPCLRHLYQ